MPCHEDDCRSGHDATATTATAKKQGQCRRHCHHTVQQRRTPRRRRRRQRLPSMMFYLVVVIIFVTMSYNNNNRLMVQAAAWQSWTDIYNHLAEGDLLSSLSNTKTLTIEEISVLRVRDIKRRLAREHGYELAELAKMLDKKELIQALAFEEEKIRLSAATEVQRVLFKRGIITAMLAVLLVMCWPLLHHAYEVAAVNFVVYTDRKRYEVRRCWELKSAQAMVGILIMFIIQMLQLWLTASILLSWVMPRSAYFFPTPHFPIRPAQMMGGPVSQSALANYGINVGPMVISWAMRFVHAKVEAWTGRALSAATRQATQQRRQAARANETAEERAQRKAARKKAKETAQHQQQQQQRQPMIFTEEKLARSATRATAPSNIEHAFFPTNGTEEEDLGPPDLNSNEHQEFLNQLAQHNSELDDLD